MDARFQADKELFAEGFYILLIVHMLESAAGTTPITWILTLYIWSILSGKFTYILALISISFTDSA